MSREAVEAIIGRAVLDSEFRSALFANAEETLAGYGLSDVEMTALKAVDAETLESFAGVLEDRISKSLPIGVTPEGFFGPREVGTPTPHHLPEGF